jgi:hypothetical protein
VAATDARAKGSPIDSVKRTLNLFEHSSIPWVSLDDLVFLIDERPIYGLAFGNERHIYGLELNVGFFSYIANRLNIIRRSTSTSAFAPVLDGAVGGSVCIHHLGWDRDGSSSIRQRSICHERIVDEVHDATGKRWRRRHF